MLSNVHNCFTIIPNFLEKEKVFLKALWAYKYENICLKTFKFNKYLTLKYVYQPF